MPKAPPVSRSEPWAIPGLRLCDHELEVPLDHDRPERGSIAVSILITSRMIEMTFRSASSASAGITVSRTSVPLGPRISCTTSSSSQPMTSTSSPVLS